MTQSEYNLSEREYQLCTILWDYQPTSSSKLILLCKEFLNWNKSTTYTYLRRLSQKGILQWKKAKVSMLVSKEEVQQEKINRLIETTFEGSAGELLVLFLKRNKNE